jgi:hypothetical protein
MPGSLCLRSLLPRHVDLLDVVLFVVQCHCFAAKLGASGIAL